MCFGAEKRHPLASERSDQRLHDPVGINCRKPTLRFDLAECRGNHEQPMTTSRHLLKPGYKGRTVCGERANKIRQILPFHHALIFESSNGVVAKCKGAFRSRQTTLQSVNSRADSAPEYRSAALPLEP